jgi:hypothetical protein
LNASRENGAGVTASCSGKARSDKRGGAMRATTMFGAMLPLAACAGLQFNDAPTSGALTYREPVPYVFVALAKDCSWTATVISLPGPQRSVTFKNGYGTANLSIALSNGMISSAGQQTDSKIPETITAIGGLAGSIAKAAPPPGGGKPAPPTCTPAGFLYPIGVDGKPDRSAGVSFP